ncbi:DNA mismatch repair protein MutS [Hyphobacterium sp. HN65]|uniref:DNA mismatch repair protein MutS n=1 Tax=Hyphobacterium lacteum TaxID=3116575 RepID=A0ABU7LRY3_9PROT|nr:DNA mismatch repair protein MutS [Hyphobacterium sp. HN65]MEE2526677.1 DNA mismatch repair protein MutS [Hyphobacterium sp. HN65]
MMAQFLALREDTPKDALLFYRMGDFYELFFDDARRASEALDIALTQRGQHQGEPIPMCGVPAATAEAYLARLIKAGFKVAVGEQLEDPAAAKARGSKTVERGLTRIVTPGTLTEDSLLDARSSNRIAALSETAGGGTALAWAEVSTGEFAVSEIDSGQLAAEISALNPAELLVREESYTAARDWVPAGRITPQARAKFDAKSGERRLKERFSVQSLEAFGSFSAAELAALGALLDYLELAQAGAPAKLSPPRQVQPGHTLLIDPATRASLEIDRTLTGDRKGSLLDCIDETVTAPGARLLAARLTRPSTDLAAIRNRHDLLAHFIDSPVTERVRERLKAAGDLERAATRLVLSRSGPRDLAALRRGLAEAQTLSALLLETPGIDAPGHLGSLAEMLNVSARAELAALQHDLEAALVDEPGLAARDGGFIAAGWIAALDEARALRDDSRKLIAGLQQTYGEASGVSNLKIKHNNVLGYFVEVTAKNADPLMADEAFIHRQTMANAVRFTTTELGALESKIAGAADRALALELEAFSGFRDRVEAQAETIRSIARALAEIDVACANAQLAQDRNWARPDLGETPVFTIVSGRHPVVEASLKAQGEAGFTPNDCRLSDDAERLLLVTGPNMAGKSTYLRQNALMLILAQAGLYVPASEARIGIADRLFSRVGAADDLARGRSTFMNEMVETSAILNQATARSFVILDEVGRGTSTFDGLSIAWAAAEHLHEVNRCRALFATHYHELTRLAEDLDHAGNVSLKAREWKGELVFLHQIAEGPADKSYGIEVARRAGLPKAAIARAKTILERLESEDAPSAALAELPLFSATPMAQESKPSLVSERLKRVVPDELSPRDALECLYELKRLADEESE